jgi:hypothetical protein
MIKIKDSQTKELTTVKYYFRSSLKQFQLGNASSNNDFVTLIELSEHAVDMETYDNLGLKGNSALAIQYGLSLSSNDDVMFEVHMDDELVGYILRTIDGTRANLIYLNGKVVFLNEMELIDYVQFMLHNAMKYQ